MTAPPKVVDNFRNLNHGDALLQAGSIFSACTLIRERLDKWTPGTTTIDDLGVVIEKFRDAYNLAQGGGLHALAVRDTVREELNLAVYTVGHQIETLAINDPQLIPLTGYELRKRRGRSTNITADNSPLSPLLSMSHGTHPGMLIGKAPRVSYAGSYELQMTIGDPNVEEGWTTVCQRKYCKRLEVSGLVSGQKYYFRLRAIGANNVGPWSLVVGIIAL